MARRARRTACLFLFAATAIGGAVAAPASPGPARWIRVDYGALVDGRALTHSGESVAVLLQRLSGRPIPTGGDRRDDALTHRILDPLLEPYAFVLSDALDTLSPPPDPPMVEVGSLWDQGDAQPAWVELVRARFFVLESDGEGHVRACLPASSLEAFPGAIPDANDPIAIAKEAWDKAWPVLRHALAGERLRLQRVRGGELPSLDVEVHAYRHLPALSVFDLSAQAWRTTVSANGPSGDRAAFDLSGLQAILDRGVTIEGARLEPSGRLRFFTSEPETKPSILGRPPSLADIAVAYRAIAYGGYGQPYMSLDRGTAPHVANVNYGGRLRDTALGLVSLLSDVRFKTFSLGIDLLGDGDLREVIRRKLPEFLTHLERFASDASAGAILNQQTRFWFYPDDVDLTVSEQGDVLAFRKVRMSAASERVQDAGAVPSQPAWTKNTVSYLNTHYDALESLFSELADLDESVRLLALFTWLEAAKNRGLPVPDLDVLMAQELPAFPTPRRFPELLSHDVLPAPGTTGIVDVLDRTEVGDALSRLEPAGGRVLPAQRRFARDLAMLDPQLPDHVALAKEMSALAPDSTPMERDVMSYRAERLLMHARVLGTISASRRASIEGRRKQQPATRVFSVGIGGIDLDMTAVLGRAAHRGGRLGVSSSDRGPASDAPVERASVMTTTAAADPPSLPQSEWPDHGMGPAKERTVTALPDRAGTIVERRRSGSLVRQGTFKPADGSSAQWAEFVLAMDGPEACFRRTVRDSAGGAPAIQRVDQGRFLSFRFVRDGAVLRAAPAIVSLPSQAFGVASKASGPAALPPGLTMMDLPTILEEVLPSERAEPLTVPVRVRSADGHERAATIPRAILQRLVRGRAIDTTPERPLQAFTPAVQVLGASRALMVLQAEDQTRPPWSGPIAVRPGEEDATRLAAALSRWWSSDPGSTARAIVGVDASASPERWARAPTLDGTLAMLPPVTASLAQAATLRDGFRGIPSVRAGVKVVIVVSAESPGVLGRRLRALALDPELAGKILVAVSLSGPLRTDLPASLLGEGRIAALGLYEAGPVGFAKTIGEVSNWARTAGSEASRGKRVEELDGPFTWFY